MKVFFLYTMNSWEPQFMLPMSKLSFTPFQSQNFLCHMDPTKRQARFHCYEVSILLDMIIKLFYPAVNYVKSEGCIGSLISGFHMVLFFGLLSSYKLLPVCILCPFSHRTSQEFLFTYLSWCHIAKKLSHPYLWA